MTKSDDKAKMIKTFNGGYGCGHIHFPANKSNRSKWAITVNPTDVINTKKPVQDHPIFKSEIRCGMTDNRKKIAGIENDKFLS